MEREPSHPIASGATSAPIFIFGVTRSGTTLLARMLDLHPAFSIYLESWFLNLLSPETAEASLPGDTEVGRVLDQVRALAEQGVSRAAVESRFAASDHSLRSLFDIILRLRMEERGKRRYGEKTPSHFTRLPIVLAWYPQAKLVYLHRDPRDVYASFKRSRDYFKLGWLDRTLLGRSLYWSYYEEAAQEASRRLPAQVFEVGFEALIRDPPAMLRALCEFLGEPFDAAMLGVEENNSSFPETRSKPGLRTEVVGRQLRLSGIEAGCIELICGDLMQARGYRLSSPVRHLVPLLSWLGVYSLVRLLHVLLRQRRVS